MNKQDLIDFEKRVKKVYEAGEIKAPIHLSGNNEDQLIKIFKKRKLFDWSENVFYFRSSKEV